jgi:hypothetical protein
MAIYMAHYNDRIVILSCMKCQNTILYYATRLFTSVYRSWMFVLDIAKSHDTPSAPRGGAEPDGTVQGGNSRDFTVEVSWSLWNRVKSCEVLWSSMKSIEIFWGLMKSHESFEVLESPVFSWGGVALSLVYLCYMELEPCAGATFRTCIRLDIFILTQARFSPAKFNTNPIRSDSRNSIMIKFTK